MTDSNRSDAAFTDYLPLSAVRFAPGEYAIKDRTGRTLWTMSGAALADWVCQSVNGYDSAVSAMVNKSEVIDHTERLVDIFAAKAVELHKVPGAFTNQLAYVAAQYIRSLDHRSVTDI